MGDLRRRIGHVVGDGRKVDDLCLHGGQLSGSGSHLQREEFCVLDIEQRFENREKNGSVAVILVFRIPGPGQPHPQPGGPRKCRGFLLRFFGNGKIRNLRGDCLQRGPEGQRKTHQGTMAVKFRQRISGSHSFGNTGQERGDSLQFRGKVQHHTATSSLNHRQIAQKLERVAQSLFSMKQDARPIEWLAAPQRLGETSQSKFLVGAPFIVAPAGRKVSEKQLG